MPVEGRAPGRKQLSRRNVMNPSEVTTTTETKLRKIAILSASDVNKEFHSLMHHYNMESLRVCFEDLGTRKKPGPRWGHKTGIWKRSES